MTRTATVEAPSGGSRELARGGAASFLGAAISALMGFVLVVVLARFLGDVGSGVVLQAIAIFSIVLSFARAGMDSTAVWVMPRLAHHDPPQIRAALGVMLLTTAIAGLACGLGTVLLAPLFALTGDPHAPQVVEAVSIVGWFLPLGALVLVALSATRGLGGIGPYVAVGSIGLPASRPLVVALVAALGGSLSMVTLGWAAPLPVALAAALVVLAFQVRRHERAADVRGTFRAPPSLRKTIRHYALPRVISAGLEQSILWLDVVLVGVIGGSAAAGVYGGASRFVAAGMIIDTSLRVVVAPTFSRLLFLKKTGEAGALYRVAATWLILFSTPIYLILGLFAPVVLGWLGPGFVDGSAALAILCAGAILTFTAGNVHTVLLMSGRSGWDALNKAVVLAVNIVGNILLIPVMGIVGAALTWAISMLIDAALTAVEVRIFLGIGVAARTVGYALLVPLAAVGAPAMILRMAFGATLASMVASIAIGGVLLVAWGVLDRRRLHLHDLSLLARRAPARA